MNKDYFIHHKKEIFFALVLATLVFLLYFLRGESNMVFEGQQDIPQEETNEKVLSKGVWHWKSPTQMNDEEIGKTLEFCKQEKIDTIYLYTDDVLGIYLERSPQRNEKLSRYQETLKNFVTQAHAKNIKVHALGGAPDWVDPSGQEAPLQFFDFILLYNRSVPPEARVDGIQYDVEPYGPNGFYGEGEILPESYLDMADSIVKKYQENAYLNDEGFELGFAVPYWFDGENDQAVVGWKKGNKKGMGLHLFDILNRISHGYVAVMDYRNFARGKDGSIAHAQGEMKYARESAPQVRIIIGQEVSNVKPSKITFYGTSKQFLEAELQRISAAFKHEDAFVGFAIHDLESYMKME